MLPLYNIDHTCMIVDIFLCMYKCNMIRCMFSTIKCKTYPRESLFFWSDHTLKHTWYTCQHARTRPVPARNSSLGNSSSIQISRNTVRPFQLSNCLEILHRARQYHCRALYKIAKQLDNWERCYGRTRFREIWVEDEFRVDILCYTTPQGLK